MGTECRKTFALPTSPEYYHENCQHPIGRATSLTKLFGRSSPLNSHHSYNQNTASLLLVDLNREASMSHTSNRKASGPSGAGSRKDMSHENPIALTIIAPKPRKTPKEGPPPLLRRMASLSTESPKRERFELELKPRKSMEDIRNFDRQPQIRTHIRNSGFAWPFHKSVSPASKIANQSPSRKHSLPEEVPKFHVVGRGGSGSQFPFHKSGSPASNIAVQLPSRKQSSRSLPEVASKFRVVGRGGSGSQLRQVSVSGSVGPDVPPPRQLPKADFYRPTGRGGFGSSARPLTPPKPPTSVLDLLSGRGRMQSQAQRSDQCKSHEVPPPARTQALSPNLDSLPPHDDLIIISSYTQVLADDLFDLSPSAASSTSDGLSYISDDYSFTNSYIEEPIRPMPVEHHQRSLDKLSRTLGALPAPLMEGFQSGSVSKSSVSFNKLPQKYSETLSTNLGESMGSRSSHRSLNSSMFLDDLHRFDYAGDLSKAWGDLDDGSTVEDDTPHSPITFAPASPPKNTLQPLPLSDTNSSLTTGGSNPGYSYSSTEPSLSSPDSPSSTHLRVPGHSTPHSVFLYDDIPQGPNGLSAKANWLVPLGRHNDEVVISITRAAPANHPQSWIGEWNNDMQDVIESLRRL